MNILKKLLGLNGHEEINTLKKEIKVLRESDVKDLQDINKRLRLTIESGTIDVVIKDIKEVMGGK